MKHGIWVCLWLVFPALGASAAESKEKRWHFGMESVFAGSESGGALLPGFGLGIGGTPAESGFVFDAGIYVFPQDLSQSPLYFRGGHQFNPHFRLFGYLGAGNLDLEGDILVLVSGVEGEWLPVADDTVEIGFLGGMSFAYFILPLAPHLGAKFQARVSRGVSVHTIVRTPLISGELAVLGSAGLRINY